MALSEIAERVKNLTSKRLKVGWFEDKLYPETLKPVAQVAIENEFGTQKIPARPFMRPAIADNKSKWMDHAEYVAGNYIRGVSRESQVFDYIGRMIAADIYQAIENVHEPKLSDYTVAMRRERRGMKANEPTPSGLLKPLEDTHQMIESITHQVVDK